MLIDYFFPRSPSNYLAYVNSLLYATSRLARDPLIPTPAFGRFYRVGGATRYAGFLLALATFGLLLVGTGPIAYIRTLSVRLH